MRKLVQWPSLAIDFGLALLWNPTPAFIRSSGQWMTAVLAAGMVISLPEAAMAQAVPQNADVSAGAVPADPLFKVAPVPGASASAPLPRTGTGTATRQRQGKAASVENARPSTASADRLVWDKTPLQIALGIGPASERAVTFPAQMHIGVPPDIAHLLRVQTVGQTSYFTAVAPFARSRVVAEDRATGAVILLDLTASKDSGATGPITVVVPMPDARTLGAGTDVDDAQPPVDMVMLTRFAARQMYAPRRLAAPHPAIRRVLVDGTPLDDLYAGAGVRATPAAQWRSDQFHLTAVTLQNLRPEPIELDPLQVRGRWRAITFHHARLHARGSEADTTVVYLVCDRSFRTCR
jgi:integrating conjugative element protein (TIGR03749 family)